MIVNFKRSDGVPISYFLNNMYIWMTAHLAQVFALAWWLVMSFYFLICIIKGNIMLCASLAGFLGLHPFKYLN